MKTWFLLWLIIINYFFLTVLYFKSLKSANSYWRKLQMSGKITDVWEKADRWGRIVSQGVTSNQDILCVHFCVLLHIFKIAKIWKIPQTSYRQHQLLVHIANHIFLNKILFCWQHCTLADRSSCIFCKQYPSSVQTTASCSFVLIKKKIFWQTMHVLLQSMVLLQTITLLQTLTYCKTFSPRTPLYLADSSSFTNCNLFQTTFLCTIPAGDINLACPNLHFRQNPFWRIFISWQWNFFCCPEDHFLWCRWFILTVRDSARIKYINSCTSWFIFNLRNKHQLVLRIRFPTYRNGRIEYRIIKQRIIIS